MTFWIGGFIGSVMGSSWTSEVGVIGSNLHLESPWKSAGGSGTDGGTGQEGSPDATLWWVRLGYERINENLRAKPAQPVFVNCFTGTQTRLLIYVSTAAFTTTAELSHCKSPLAPKPSITIWPLIYWVCWPLDQRAVERETDRQVHHIQLTCIIHGFRVYEFRRTENVFVTSKSVFRERFQALPGPHKPQRRI